MKVDKHRTILALQCSRWGVPLLLTLLVIPLSILYSPRVILPHGQAYLIALLPAAALSLLFLYGARLLAAIVLVTLGTLYLAYGLTPLLAVGGPFSLTLLLCCWGYTLQSGERWRAGLARPKLLWPRLFWLAGMFPLLFILLTQIIVTHGDVFWSSLLRRTHSLLAEYLNQLSGDGLGRPRRDPTLLPPAAAVTSPTILASNASTLPQRTGQ